MTLTQEPPPPAGPGDVFAPVLAEMREELAALVDVPVWSLDEARLNERLGDVLALKAQVEELAARLVGEVDDRDLPRRHGASSTRAHLMAAYQMSAAEASRTVAAARQLEGPSALTEPTRRAVAAGDISTEQAVVIATAINRLSPTIGPARVEAVQTDLIQHVRSLSFSQLQVVANHLVEVVDPDGADEILETQLADQERKARASATFVGQLGPDGMARGRFAIPNLHLAMLRKTLEAEASPRRANVLADDGSGDALAYTTRMGQAFCSVIEHLPMDKLPQHGVASASIVVTLDEQRLRAGAGEATLDTGGAISASEVRRLACNADIVPAVLSGGSTILDLGMARRLFDRHQRLALAVRDRGCVFAGCERPPAWCEAHHLTPWSQGGPTDLDNGCLLCSFHHHLIHQGEWGLAMAADGVVEVIPPARTDPQRRPIRHERRRPRDG